MRDKYSRLKKIIEQNERFVITSHIYTDGDALGSALTFFHYLSGLGKKADILIPGDIPPKYAFLKTDQHVNRYNSEQEKIVVAKADVIIILDISDLQRLDHLFQLVKESGALNVCIDHHPLEPQWVDLSIINTQKVATAELVYEYLKYAGVPLTEYIAQALYTAILSDSGGFRFQKTNQETFSMAADLVKAGANPVRLFSSVFENGRKSQLRAWGKLLSMMDSAGKISWIEVSKNFMKEHDIYLEDIDGIIDIMRKDKDAAVMAVFVEHKRNEILVGLRSKNGVDVGKIATELGGGGHYNAAGFTSVNTLDKTIEFTTKRLSDSQKIEEKSK